MGVINIMMEAQCVCNVKSYLPSSYWVSNSPGFYHIIRTFERKGRSSKEMETVYEYVS